MTTTVSKVAAAIRHELPDVDQSALCKLLYHANGHHLAWFGRPLFVENVWQWTRAALWDTPAGYGDLTNGELNTIGYMCSPGNRRDIDAGYLHVVADLEVRTSEQFQRHLRQHLAAAVVNRDKPAQPDDLDKIRAWAAELRAQAAANPLTPPVGAAPGRRPAPTPEGDPS